jgi:hypothetical protein
MGVFARGSEKDATWRSMAGKSGTRDEDEDARPWEGQSDLFTESTGEWKGVLVSCCGSVLGPATCFQRRLERWWLLGRQGHD